MIPLADGRSELDADLWASIAGKAREGALAREDLGACVRLFCMACNRLDLLRFELAGFTQTFQLALGEERFALAFEAGSCSAWVGDIESPDVSIWMSLPVALDLAAGRLNSGAAHMNGDIGYKGTKNGAVRLQSAFELAIDELGA
jgi:putative sterol carrier protein